MTGLPDLVQALLLPKAYPEQPREIELMQTQISFVFLAGDYVYKVKKPVDFGFLDYTTLGKRQFYCAQEVTLNRRLCPDVYLGVVEIVRDKGEIRVGGEGEVIEYAVKMRRLPQQRMMDRLLRSGEVSEVMVARVARKMAEFHRRAETGSEIAAWGALDIVSKNTEENFAQTEKYIGVSLSRQMYQGIESYAHSFMARNASLFGKRVEEGRIRDCHGDLHAAHVCLSDGICIFDCIEFNDRFRYTDVASEIAFLAMDLDYYGRRDLSGHFAAVYVEESGDKELLRLLDFYKCYRAYVRGKVESFKLDDPLIPSGEKETILKVAGRYFDLAYYYTQPRPALLITCGLIGSGKTALAEALGRRAGLAVISSDVTRKRLANIPATEHRFEEFDGGIYSRDFSLWTYEKMFEEAREIMARGQSVVLDASFRKAAERERAMKLAEEAGADFWLIECACDEETIRQRLGRRRSEGSVSDGRLEIFEELKRDFEEIAGVPATKHLVVDTSGSVEQAVEQVLERIGGLVPQVSPGAPK